jgi:hypothetical protein
MVDRTTLPDQFMLKESHLFSGRPSNEPEVDVGVFGPEEISRLVNTVRLAVCGLIMPSFLQTGSEDPWPLLSAGYCWPG